MYSFSTHSSAAPRSSSVGRMSGGSGGGFLPFLVEDMARDYGCKVIVCI